MHHIGTFFKGIGSYATGSPAMALEQMRVWSLMLDQAGKIDITPYAKLLEGVDTVWGFTYIATSLSSLFHVLAENPEEIENQRVEHVARFLTMGCKAAAFVAERYFRSSSAVVGSLSVAGAVLTAGCSTVLASEVYDDWSIEALGADYSNSLMAQRALEVARSVALVGLSALQIGAYTSFTISYAFPVQIGLITTFMASDLVTHMLQTYRDQEVVHGAA